MLNSEARGFRIFLIALVQLTAFMVMALLPVRTRPSKPATDHRTTAVVQQFTQKNLAQIFLSNTGKIPSEERSVYLTTGLMHHLAISAGQIGPTISFTLLIASCLAHCFPTSLFTRFLSCRQILSLLFALWLAVVYGATGSLLRVFICQFCHTVLIDLLLKARLPIGPLRLPSCFTIAAMLCLTLLGRNLLHDWSFLFSTAGAHACFFATSAWSIVKKGCTIGYARIPCFFDPGEKIRFFARITLRVTEAIFNQLCCTLVFYPLGAVNVWAAIAANLVVSPLVSLGIVPLTVALTLLTQFGITQGQHISAIVYLCDKLFVLFKGVATLFAERVQEHSLAFFKPFSEESRCYFLCVIAIGFTAQVIVDELKRHQSFEN